MSMGKYDARMIDPTYGGRSPNWDESIAVRELRIGSGAVTEEDLIKFKKLLGFMDFAMSASPELRNLMVAYEAKQRILK